MRKNIFGSIIAALALLTSLGPPLAAQREYSVYSPGTNPAPTAFGNIILNGNVLIADGSPPPEAVAIEQVCASKIVRLGFTDAQGFFSFNFIRPLQVLQDASGTGHDANPARANVNATGYDDQAPPTADMLEGVVGCELRGVLTGYQSSSVMVRTKAAAAVNVGTIFLAAASEKGASVSATSLNAPENAKKAYKKAAAQFRRRKLAEAQTELEHAVKVYPRYAAAWTDLGWLHEQQNRLTEARTAFTEARKADASFAPPYIGLASVAIREAKWSEAEELSARATQLNAVEFPIAFYYNALANLQVGRLSQAEQSGRMAERLAGTALPHVRLLLGSILALEGKYADAAEELQTYLNLVPNVANGEKVRQRIAELKKLSASGAPPPVLSAPALSMISSREMRSSRMANWDDIAGLAGLPDPAAIGLQQDWAPPDIDDKIPPVAPGVTCPMQEIMTGISARARELVENLQQFSATERIQHLKVDKVGNENHPASGNFKYVAEIHEQAAGFEVDEYRNGDIAKQSFPANMVSTGTAAHALMFHPKLIDNLAITCEGLGRIRGQPAWQLRFGQRPNKPSSFREYRTKNGQFPLELKGRAWVKTDTYHVLRIETDLAKPIDAIALKKDHLIIDYRPVEFRKRDIELWLPETTELYVDFLGSRSHVQHSFSGFELFWVDTAQETKHPERD
jgi:tetratricopeptide (TPR) repeat protein